MQGLRHLLRPTTDPAAYLPKLLGDRYDATRDYRVVAGRSLADRYSQGWEDTGISDGDLTLISRHNPERVAAAETVEEPTNAAQ